MMNMYEKIELKTIEDIIKFDKKVKEDTKNHIIFKTA